MRHSSNGNKSTVFALVGDDFHNSYYIRTALGKTLVREGGLSIDFTDETSLLSSENLKGYRMLIIFRAGTIWPDGYLPGAVRRGIYSEYSPSKDSDVISHPSLPDIDEKPQFWMKPYQGKAVRDFVKEGGSAFFYHHSSHISLSSKDYRDVEGAVYTGHPPVRPYRVRIVNRNHPITQGVSDFVVTDEQHYVKYEKSSDFVLMKSVSLDGKTYSGTIGDQGAECEAGWAYNYGEGRVCFMSPGHTIFALWNPEYEKLQRNAVKWLLREI